MHDFSPQSAIELLQALIRIPSVNPDGDPGTTRTGEAECAARVGRFLESCGATVTFDEVFPDRPNVIGHFPSRPAADGSPKPRVLFAPHTDTVGVGGMTVDPFGGERRDGRIWGRGASDTKGTMAAMLWALWQLRDRLADLGASISFVGLMGEETGQPGAIHFAGKYRGQFDFAVVGEPTRLNAVITHKSVVWVEIATAGKAAHGASPERGENAILAMTRVLEAIDTELRDELAGYAHPLLGPSTVNIGMIRGGTRTNIVPDACTVALDFRETPALHDAGGAIGKLGEFLQRRGWAESVAVKPTVVTAPLAVDPENPFVQKLVALGAERTGAPWYCDAGSLWNLGGIPSVAIGPGSIEQAHTVDEWLAVEDFEAGVDFYRRFMESL
ncbi:MAG: M20 family metallopeptidase [Verrucomicrobiae bacterium]|nr:M20 family metallopeptidase [Verrucomicrobiae bacterium]MCP5539989.1 M20 family metallopeptidase [Akkermansiaceae bacterium]